MKMTQRIVTALALVVVGCGNCGQDNAADPDVDVDMHAPDASGGDLGSPDVGPDAGDDVVLGSRTPVAAQPGVSADGVHVDTPVPGQARAGRITDADTGFHGLWSHCKQGDFRLINERLEACISNEISSRVETFRGGGLLDVRPIGVTSPDVFDIHTGRVGFTVLHPDTVEVIRDGTDGGAAVIRVHGKDMTLGYFIGLVGPLVRPLDLDMTIEYRLGPGSDHIEILYFIENNTGRPHQIQVGDLLGWGDRMDVVQQARGPSPGGSFQWMAAYGSGYAFSFVTPDHAVTSITSSLGDPPWELTNRAAVRIEDGESLAHFAQLVVGEELDVVVGRARQLLDPSDVDPARILTVVDTAQQPVAGRTVHAFDGTTYLTGGVTDADGRVQLSLPDGEVTLDVAGLPSGGELRTDLAVADAMQVEVAQAGVVIFDITADGEMSPASLVISGNGMTMHGALWDEIDRVQLMPGTWAFTVARGIEYDAFQTTIDVVAGESTTLTVELTRVMETADWLGADFHQHMEPSSDSTVWVEDRVLNNVGHGIEVVVPTDHDVVTDLAPVIESAGLTGLLATFPGVEVSPTLAHTNVYPMPYDRTAPGRGTIPLAEITGRDPRRFTLPELIAYARALPTDPVVQINHPRDSSGLFDLVDFDPEVDPSEVDHAWFTTDFDAMELTNGDTCQQFHDLSGLWNAGVEPTPIASSDSHGLWTQVGTERTYLHAPGVEPADVTAEMVRDIVKAGRVSIATTTLVDFTDGKLPGDTVTVTGDTVEFGIRVQSADWVESTELHVIVNGERREVIALTPVDDVLDFNGTVSVTVTEDSWVMFMASGAARGDFRPFTTRPFGVTAPVRLDVGGDGYTAPGVRPLDLDDVPVCR